MNRLQAYICSPMNIRNSRKDVVQQTESLLCSNSSEGVLGTIVSPSRKSSPFLKEHENKIILFVLLHLNFCFAIEKCYYLSILSKMSIRAVKITHYELFKHKDCPIAMKIVIVLFHRVYLRVFSWLSHVDSRPFLVSQTP